MFSYKFDESGYLTKYKARIVARGDIQPLSLKEIYVATLAFRVFRALMALTAAFNLSTRQLDAILAFINARLDEIVYCYIPEGFERPGHILLLIRALYGLRRSLLLWLQILSKIFTEFGLYQIPGEPCLFTDYIGLVLFFYVDDIVGLCTLNYEKDLEALIDKIKQRFRMKDLGQLEWFLGVRVLRDRDAGKVWLCQDSYINKLATEYKLNVRGKLPQTPLPVEELIPNTDNADIECYHVYVKKIGSLIYPAVMGSY